MFLLFPDFPGFGVELGLEGGQRVCAAGSAGTELGHLQLELLSAIEDDLGDVSRGRVLLGHALDDGGRVLTHRLILGVGRSEE